MLLHAIWEGQTSVLEGILQRIRDQACNFRDRCVLLSLKAMNCIQHLLDP